MSRVDGSTKYIQISKFTGIKNDLFLFLLLVYKHVYSENLLKHYLEKTREAKLAQE